MRITSTRPHAVLALACALALGVFSAAATAQDANEKALLVNTQGGPIMTGAGECWHMAFGPAPLWHAACHPMRPAQYVAPVTRAEPAAAPAAATAPTRTIPANANDITCDQ